MPPIEPIDVEAAFLLTTQLLRLPAEVAGSIRMTAEISNDTQRDFAGVLATASEGQVIACTTERRVRGGMDIGLSPSLAGCRNRP